MSGNSYDSDVLPWGIYKHHEGSSVSSPKWANSWIGAIRKSLFGRTHREDDDWIPCSAAGCDEEGTLGAHIAESKLNEILKIVGRGGTPVVPLCEGCHGTDAIEIDDCQCIIDRSCKIDLRSAKRKLSETYRCDSCYSFIRGPDEDDHYLCDECQHYTDDEGYCITTNCSSCEDDDEGDDY
jgi:hypothetical protein